MRYVLYGAIVFFAAYVGDVIGLLIRLLICFGLSLFSGKRVKVENDAPFFAFESEAGVDQAEDWLDSDADDFDAKEVNLGKYGVFAKLRFFELFGYLCKIDGVVSRDEITGVESVFRHLDFDEDEREAAIEAFRLGKEPEFDFRATLRTVSRFNIENTFATRLLHLMNVVVANADGSGLVEEERALLIQIGQAFGLRLDAINEILMLGQGRAQFEEGEPEPAESSKTTLDLAYDVLGVEARASDKQVERAYRRLRSRYHPDKLLRSASDDEKVATEKQFKDVQKAWDVVRVHRNF